MSHTNDQIQEDNFAFRETSIGLNVPLASTSGNDKINLCEIFI